jgi:hypothetical protein
MFQKNGIDVISISLYWYRIEGNTRGSYDDSFLGDVKRVITEANSRGLQVLVTIHTLWGDDSLWCTPTYVIDPVTGQNDGLAIVRSEDMKKAFLGMFNHTVRYLAGTPGIWAWAVLNEPWYWPHTLPEPFKNIDQKASFIDLIEKMSSVVRTVDGRPVTIRFVDMHSSGSAWKNIFVDDWAWDTRLLNALDFISFNAYIPSYSGLLDTWKQVLTENVAGSAQRGKKIWITEFGFNSDDDSTQVQYFSESVKFFKTLPIEGWIAWKWRSDKAPAGWNENPGEIGKGMNLCLSADGTPRPAYWQMF